MKSVEPFEIHRPVATGRPNWVAIGTSVLLHLLLIALLILRPPEGAGAPAPPHRADGSEPQPISMPLPALPKQTKQQQAPPPPPPVREQELGPDSKHPDAKAQEAIAPHPPADPVPDPAGATKAPDPVQPDVKATPTPPDPAPTESRQSHFPTLGEMLATQSKLSPPTSDNGQPKAVVDPTKGSDAPAPASRAMASANAMGRSGLSNEDYREWRPSFPEDQGSCAEIPDLGKNADGSPVLATVIGYVYDADGHTPLVDAHLQILGTAYTTFTDGKGMYRLEFDPHLLARCRKQYVRVVAPGHESQQLTLAIGRKVQSDDVHLRRR